MATPISTASPYQLSKCLATRTAKTNNKVTSGTDTTCINKIHTSRTERMAAVDLSMEDYYAQQARVWKFRSEVIFSIFLNIIQHKNKLGTESHFINKCDNVQIVLGA